MMIVMVRMMMTHNRRRSKFSKNDAEVLECELEATDLRSSTNTPGNAGPHLQPLYCSHHLSIAVTK